MAKTDLLLQFSLGDRCVLLLSKEELQAMWKRVKDLPVGKGLGVSRELSGNAAYYEPLAEAGVLKGLKAAVNFLDRNQSKRVQAAMEGNEVMDLRAFLAWSGRFLHVFAFKWWDPTRYASVILGTPEELKELLEG